MPISHKKIKKIVTLIFFSSLMTGLNVALAESDMQLQEKALKARELIRKQAVEPMEDHSQHEEKFDVTEGFHGVFYGYLPCNEKDCDGFKMTMSLKQKNNYLLVTQFAKSSSREYYEKGKYDWNDKTHILSLLPNKPEAIKRKFDIKDDVTLILLGENAKPIIGNQDNYTLRRSDKAKSRDVHIH